MKVLLVYEGIHEGGGALKALVESILGQSIVPLEKRASELPRVIQHGKGGRLFKKAVAWVREAENLELDGVVFLTDFDKDNVGPDRIAQLSEAQADRSVAANIQRAFGVPIKSFDAWMVADEVAMKEVLGEAVNRTPDPETITDPKATAREIVGDRMALRDFYRDVASQVNLEALKSRCPKGFGPFYDRLILWTDKSNLSP